MLFEEVIIPFHAIDNSIDGEAPHQNVENALNPLNISMNNTGDDQMDNVAVGDLDGANGAESSSGGENYPSLPIRTNEPVSGEINTNIDPNNSAKYLNEARNDETPPILLHVLTQTKHYMLKSTISAPIYQLVILTVQTAVRTDRMPQSKCCMVEVSILNPMFATHSRRLWLL